MTYRRRKEGSSDKIGFLQAHRNVFHWSIQPKFSFRWDLARSMKLRMRCSNEKAVIRTVFFSRGLRNATGGKNVPFLAGDRSALSRAVRDSLACGLATVEPWLSSFFFCSLSVLMQGFGFNEVPGVRAPVPSLRHWNPACSIPHGKIFININVRSFLRSVAEDIGNLIKRDIDRNLIVWEWKNISWYKSIYYLFAYIISLLL